MSRFLHPIVVVVVVFLAILAAGLFVFFSYIDDEAGAVRLCSSLKYVNETHTLFYPALDSDIMAIFTENNIRLDEMDYVGVDQIVSKFGQFVARCEYHVRKCRLFSAAYFGETNSSDFLCDDLSILVAVKESEVDKWRQGLA